MNQEFQRLRETAQQTKQAATSAENALNRAINNCKHDWSAAKYDPEITPGGSWEASGRGSDHRPAGSYSEKRQDRWSRTCQICGSVQYTYQAEAVPTTMVPKFHNS